MRNLTAWKDKLRKALAEQWPDNLESFGPAQLCDVELGLSLLLAISPHSSAEALWAFLTGYPFPASEVASWSDMQHKALGIARHLIPYYRSEYQWVQALKSYRNTPEILRGYEIDETGHITQRNVSVAADRFQTFHRTLAQAASHRKEALRWAEAGSYYFSNRRFFSSVSFPKDLLQPPPTGHQLLGVTSKPPIDVAWSELIKTAQWIDEQSQIRGLEVVNYAKRLERVRLELVSADRRELQVAKRLTIKGLMHIIGMVSSGKSTLMDILSVWAARQGLHVTLVVGDVVSALNRAQFFCALGLSAAPVLGASNRERHLNRLHRLLSAGQPETPLSPQHIGFRWLSTVCLVDGLRDDPQPLSIGKEPCLNLYTPSSEESSKSERAYACPLYSACPSHRAQRDLVGATLWVATPASLIYTRIAAQLNPERLRFLELVYRRSDLVIIDEADQVQVQLDTMFSPSQTLMGRSAEAWLSQVQQAVTSQLNLEGRGQLRQEEVDAWCQAHDVAQSATSRIYGLLLRNQQLRQWVESDDYFTGLTLFEDLARELSKLEHTHADGDTEVTRNWSHEFDEFLKDPLGEHQSHTLATLAHQLLVVALEERRTAASIDWLRSQNIAKVPTQIEELLAQKLELALLVSILQERLDFILRRWRQVEAILRLEGGGALLFQRPPDDYVAITPAAPMGNVLAFQYLRSNDQPADAPGELRFFRCMGVGRWILLNLPTLFAADGIAGPNTLLLSGTSWAGTSPVFHVQAPVGAILRAPEHEVEAIHQSRFAYKPINEEKTGRPIRVSGLKGTDRSNALRAMTHELARRSRAGGASLLEQERQRLPDNRQRILMLVGSYEEAKNVYRYLSDELRPDWKGQISYLVPDDNQFDSEWRTDETSNATLQRGLVHQFAETKAWLLIAPLLAVERGHNILNDQQQAALGAVYFMVRPHPRPNDINYAIHSINHWAVDHHANQPWLQAVASEMTWGAIGTAFRENGFRRWRELISLQLIYSALEQTDRDAVTWGQLVSIWQVIGRLVRGGSPARVIFCDAAFAPNLTDEVDQPSQTPSLLLEMRRILSPYFNDSNRPDSVLVQALYGPLYAALKQMQGVPTDATL